METNLKNAIEATVEKANGVIAAYWQRQQYTHSKPNRIRMNVLSLKWCRLERMDHCRTEGEHTETWWRNQYPQSHFELHEGNLYRVESSYGFIALSDFFTKALGQVKTGDIHKCATWKAPAKHARGNVFGDTSCLEPFGIAYLR